MIYLLCKDGEGTKTISLEEGTIYKVDEPQIKLWSTYYKGWRRTRFQVLSNVEYLISRKQAKELPKWE